MMVPPKAIIVCGLTLLVATWTLKAETVDPRGPIAYPGMNAVADEQGAQVHGYSFGNECRKRTPWQAQWIWLGGEQSPQCGHDSQGDHPRRKARASEGMADGRHEVPPVRQRPAGLARAGGHGQGFRGRRHAPLVLRSPGFDALFHEGKERHRGGGVPAMADRLYRVARQAGLSLRGGVVHAGTRQADREIRCHLARDARDAVPRRGDLRRRQGTTWLAIAGFRRRGVARLSRAEERVGSVDCQ